MFSFLLTKKQYYNSLYVVNILVSSHFKAVKGTKKSVWALPSGLKDSFIPRHNICGGFLRKYLSQTFFSEQKTVFKRLDNNHSNQLYLRQNKNKNILFEREKIPKIIIINIYIYIYINIGTHQCGLGGLCFVFFSLSQIVFFCFCFKYNC